MDDPTNTSDRGWLSRQMKSTQFSLTMQRFPCLIAAIHDWREYERFPERLEIVEVIPGESRDFRRLIRVHKLVQSELWAHASTSEFGGRIVRVMNADLNDRVNIAKALIMKFQINPGRQSLPIRTVFICPVEGTPFGRTVRIFTPPEGQEQNLSPHIIRAAD